MEFKLNAFKVDEEISMKKGLSEVMPTTSIGSTDPVCWATHEEKPRHHFRRSEIHPMDASESKSFAEARGTADQAAAQEKYENLLQELDELIGVALTSDAIATKVVLKSYSLLNISLPKITREIDADAWLRGWKQLKRNINEIHAHRSLTHPNVVPFIDCFRTTTRLTLVSKFIDGGDLLNMIKVAGPMCEDTAAPLFQKIVRSVCHCHRRGITHRDLKVDNILLSKKGGVFLADFGMCAFFTKDSDTMFDGCGTPLYASPEVINIGYKGSARGYSAVKVDSWGLGTILYSMLTGTSPFEGTSFEELRHRISTTTVLFPTSLSIACKSLLDGMLDKNPETRLSSSRILNHPWCSSARSPIFSFSAPSGLQHDVEESQSIDPLEDLSEICLGQPAFPIPIPIALDPVIPSPIPLHQEAVNSSNLLQEDDELEEEDASYGGWYR